MSGHGAIGMTDYLGEIGRTGRVLAIVGLGLASTVLAALNLLVVILLADEQARAEIPEPLIASGVTLGLLSFTSFWMLLRLLRRRRSPNRVTMMPVAFIQLGGLLFGAGIIFAAAAGGQTLFLIEGAAIALNMILLPRLLRSHGPTQASA